MRRVKANVKFKQHPYYPEAGDIISMDDESAAVVIRHGWGEDADTGETAAPTRDEVTLSIDSAAHATTSEAR